MKSYKIKGTNAKFLETYKKDSAFIYCLTGAARTGKTQVVAPVFLEDINNSNPNDTFAIGTQSKGTFETVIAKAFKEYDSNVSIRQTQGGNYIINGREVIPYTYSDKSMGIKKRGATIKTAWMDEGHASPENIFNDLLGRLSREDSKMFITSNPDGATHWIYRTFILNAEMKGRYAVKMLGARKSIVFPSTMDEYRISNGGHINDEYVDMLLNTLPEIEIRRLVYGEHIDSVGRIFDISTLNFYSGIIDERFEVKALIDPAFGQENCFTSCIIYQKIGGKYQLIDSGLLRSNAVDTVDEVILRFLNTYPVKTVFIESNFGQGELAKKIARTHSVSKFYVKENKIKRIVNRSIDIRDKVLFPESWKNVPNIGYDKWVDTSDGRGYIALSQLLSFSDIDNENCIKGQDLSYVDFPDALASILDRDKTFESNNQILETQQQFDPFEITRTNNYGFV